MRRRRVDLASVHAGPTYFGFEGREIPFLVSSCLSFRVASQEFYRIRVEVAELGYHYWHGRRRKLRS